ncbi:MAG: hypothetical protein AAGG51_29665 [Cyanobacteria bacterium P01_G01_bin.54]
MNKRKKKPKSVVHANHQSGQRAGEALIEAVENQIREGTPRETKQTLNRLMLMGETRENALQYIACALSVELQEMFRTEQPYNEARYIRNLRALPKLPYPESEF